MDFEQFFNESMFMSTNSEYTKYQVYLSVELLDGSFGKEGHIPLVIMILQICQVDQFTDHSYLC